MRRWDWLERLIVENGYTYGAELGVKEGRMTEHLLATNPTLSLIAVDLWAHQPQQAGIEGGETYDGWDFEAIRKEFDARTAPFAQRLTVMHMSTQEAAKDLYGRPKEPKLDFVFVDAEHTYSGVRADILDWGPLVRSGGLICGHDFNHKWPGVQRAVLEILEPLDVFLGPDSCWGYYKP